MSSFSIADIDDEDVEFINNRQFDSLSPQKFEINIFPPVFQLYNIQLRQDILAVKRRF